MILVVQVFNSPALNFKTEVFAVLANVAWTGNTDKDYCIFHTAHNDYNYSQKWVDWLVQKANDEQKFAAIKAGQIGGSP